jgi:hypothetical protein
MISHYFYSVLSSLVEEKLFEYFLIASRSIFETYMMFFGVPFIQPENFPEIA